MSQPQAHPSAEPETEATPLPAVAAEEIIEDDLLVEEISIDGMCGVY